MSDLAQPAPGRPDPGAEGALLARLFEQHGRTVYGLCRLLLRDTSDAEDAAQQTFLSAYRALVGGVVPRDAGAWLATIARNECRNRVRTRMREPLMLETHFIGATEPLEDTAALAEQVAELKAALRELPEKQREAVLLRDVYGLRYGEIAIAIGATRPAVEALLFRARRRLQGRLRPLRDATAALLVPVPLRDALAEVIPGFAAGGGGGAAGAAVGLTAAKIATATLLVGTAGTTVAVVGSSDRAHHAPRPAAGVAAEAPAAPVREPSRRVVVPAVPVANVAAKPSHAVQRVKTEKGEDDERREARVADTDDDDDNRGNDEERTEERGDSSGPGPGLGHAVRKQREHEDHADERRDRGKEAKDEANKGRRKEHVRVNSSHSGRGGGEEDDEHEDRSGRGGGDESDDD